MSEVFTVATGSNYDAIDIITDPGRPPIFSRYRYHRWAKRPAQSALRGSFLVPAFAFLDKRFRISEYELGRHAITLIP